MKEWDAPESNKTEAGVELTRNIPSTTLGFSWATSASTCIALPVTPVFPKKTKCKPYACQDQFSCYWVESGCGPKERKE
jgi:hypothetical protein